MTSPDLSQNNEAVDDFLSSFVVAGEDDAQQHGVKGQKWGVRKAGPGDHSVFKVTADKAPKVGKTFEHGGQTHTVVRAATRSDGKHIVTTRPTATIAKERKAELGAKLVKIVKKDKEYWQKSAAIVGVGLAGLAAAAVAPALLPASAILAAGGPAVLSSNIALSTAIATRGAYAHNYIQYIRRSKSPVVKHAVLGNKASVGDVYDNLTPTQKNAADSLIAAYSKGESFDGDTVIQTGWASMTPTERSVVLFLASGTAPDNVAHAEVTIDSILEHAVKLGSKKGKPGHILFIARGSAPKVGSQFNHQGAPHQVVKVDTSSSDPKRHMVTAKKVDAKAVAHADLDAWETYLIEDDEDADYFEHHGVKGQKWGVRKDQLGLTAITAGASKGDGGAVSVGQRNDPKNPAPPPSKKDAANLAKATTQARDGALGKQSLDRIDALNKAVLKDLDAKKYEWNDAAQKSYEKHVAVHMEEGAKANIKVKGVTAWCRPLGDNTFMLHVGHADAIAAFQKDHNLAHAQMTGVSSVHITAQRDAKGFVTGLTAGATVLEHSELVGEIIASAVDAQQHGIKGMKWGVRRAVDSATGRVEMKGNTGLEPHGLGGGRPRGLNPRTGSADQIAQDRIQKKIDSVGVHALSTAELQSYSRRLQVEKDVNRVLAEQSAAQKAASQSFITKFVKRQAGRQASRVVDKALDVAVEKALHQAGINIGKKGGNPDAADLLVKTATRLAPKKGK